jgi:hypothetical protein
VAYVRKVRTTSGAVAVQVARKDQGRVVILAHLGSAHTDAELGILLEQARQMVVGGQAALDFEVAARAQSMADVPDFLEQALITAPAAPTVASVVPPGRTMGASSRLLYDVFGGVYEWLGFDVVADSVFRDLVIARIVEPTSKADAERCWRIWAQRRCPTERLPVMSIRWGPASAGMRSRPNALTTAVIAAV